VRGHYLARRRPPLSLGYRHNGDLLPPKKQLSERPADNATGRPRRRGQARKDDLEPTS
jgi:hypothetical protein